MKTQEQRAKMKTQEQRGEDETTSLGSRTQKDEERQ